MTEPSQTTRPKARERGRMRRRLRERQELREALLAELGALVFELHRHDRREPELLQAKAAELAVVDEEVRALADALEQEVPVTELAAGGLLARCPECESLLAVDAHFCSSCGAAQRPEYELDRAPPISEAPALETRAFEPAVVEEYELEPEPEPYEPEPEPYEPEPEQHEPEPEPEPEVEPEPPPAEPAAPWLAEATVDEADPDGGPPEADSSPPEPDSSHPEPDSSRSEPLRVKRPMSRLERTLRGKRKD
jgi:hypothetical protein